jgi:small subunit ribosomal protein S17
MAARGNRRCEVGVVVSDKMNKSITVQVRRLVRHPRYGKYYYQTTRCHAHDENNAAKAGDKVEIMEARPTSKLKRWRLVNVLERATI